MRRKHRSAAPGSTPRRILALLAVSVAILLVLARMAAGIIRMRHGR